METISDLQAQLSKLRHLRSNGIFSVSIEGQETKFRSDAELAAAIADVERRLSIQSNGRITTIRLSSSKGF
ncbi:phage head-tail joining protein [Methylobacterium trifolii]|uniref:phage head-tail joining protein n=1 Tax=Methylobacterium trifolii TaxID=1003092 RepID=UPI001EDF6639|nr:hypothetical protein [Methylobacterium trifolii]